MGRCKCTEQGDSECNGGGTDGGVKGLTGVKGMLVSGRSLLLTAISIPAQGNTPRSATTDVTMYLAH